MWNEFQRSAAEWRASKDAERLELFTLYHDGFACHETDPERTFALFTRGRDEASRLGETWWVLFFESWRLTALTSHAMNFTRALPLAMQLMAQINSPVYRTHEWWGSVLTNVLYTYICIDPVGYRDEIERGSAHLEARIPNAPSSDRLVLENRRVSYLCDTDRLEEARDRALVALALVDRARSAATKVWHEAWLQYELCKIYGALGRMDALAGHADRLAELSPQNPQLRSTHGIALCWQAVIKRAVGDQLKAAKLFHRGMRLMSGLDRCEVTGSEPVARYYELGGELREALAVRERELIALTNRGMLHRVCLIRIERCRLLKQLNDLTAADIAAMRESASQLRVPEWYLGRINNLESA